MARKPNITAVSKQKHNNSFEERDFIEGVFNNEYILVIGSEVVLNPSHFPGTNGDINQYIINEINNDRRLARKGFIDYKNFTEIFRNTSIDEVDPIYSLLTDDYDYALEDISIELTNLLRTKLFRFILTTTIDHYIETLMRDIWGDELRIVNIEDMQSLQDLQTELSKCRNIKYSQPTLFYVFGCVTKGRPHPRNFVETDVDAIKIIEKWIKLDTGKEYLIPFLKSKRILALGCKFDDWYFRFFWYILTRSFGFEDRYGNEHTMDNLAIFFEENNSFEQSLHNYLTRIGVCIHKDPWAFMQYVYTILTSTDDSSPFRQLVLDKRREGGIFISYRSSDVLVASELFCRLSRERNLNVWFDIVSLNIGDEYTDKIKDAISRAKIFIPLLSSDIAVELKLNGTKIDTFYSHEWRMASENKELAVLPLAINGYNLRSAEHKIFEEIIHHQSSGIDISYSSENSFGYAKEGYEKLIESIYKQLGISE